MAVNLRYVIICVTLLNYVDKGVFLKINITGLELDRWWGSPDMMANYDTSIRPFKIHFDKQMINDLRTRLHYRRNAKPPLKGVGFRYGYSSNYVHDWADYWADEYPFEQREEYLNRFPMYRTNVQGLDVQFVWIKPQVPDHIPVVPVLMMHGWPGSIREFYDTIPLITKYPNERDFAVELVVPQFPGFGFSDPTYLPGLGSPEVGVVMRNLMHRLGHEQYYIQGGDLGAVTGSYMATMFSKEVLGFHTNLAVVPTLEAVIICLVGAIDPNMIVDPKLADRMYPLSKTFSFLMEESGYLHEQASKPDTVGISFADSPTGLLTYILEKFSSGTNPEFRDYPDGGLSDFNKDPILDNVMMYWSSNSMTTAIRFYAETFNKRNLARNINSIPTSVPTWAIQAKHEIIYQPPSILKLKFPSLLKARPLDFGGHFFAFDNPEFFADDVLTAIGEFRKWHANNKLYFEFRPTKQEQQREINARAINNFIKDSGLLTLAFNYLNLNLMKSFWY